jgi:alpha 1,3-glucosidase
MYIGGTGLLVKPVVTEDGKSVDVYLADNVQYFDYFNFKEYKGKGKHTIEAPLEKIPLLMRSGHIIPRKDRARRSSALMKADPYTLVVVLGDSGDASGELYIDDGETFDYQQGAFIHRKFQFDWASNALASVDAAPEKGKLYDKIAKAMHKVRVERVLVVNAPKAWKDKKKVVVMRGGTEKMTKADLKFYQGDKGHASWAVVKDPKVGIGSDWSISFA